jgi:hypothetical protein
MDAILVLARQAALRRGLCSSCAREQIRSKVSNGSRSMGLQNSNRILRRQRSNIARAGDQAKPLEGFYAGEHMELRCLEREV